MMATPRETPTRLSVVRCPLSHRARATSEIEDAPRRDGTRSRRHQIAKTSHRQCDSSRTRSLAMMTTPPQMLGARQFRRISNSIAIAFDRYALPEGLQSCALRLDEVLIPRMKTANTDGVIESVCTIEISREVEVN
jgi:hypothetical protein